MLARILAVEKENKELKERITQLEAAMIRGHFPLWVFGDVLDALNKIAESLEMGDVQAATRIFNQWTTAATDSKKSVAAADMNERKV